MKLFSKSGLLSISLGFIGILIFFLSFIRESSHQVQSRLGVSPSPMIQNSQDIKVPHHSDYALPYPGILPPNPLYPVKMIRDRVKLILTRRPNQQAKVLLHYADKRLATAEQLSIQGMCGEAVNVAVKGEIYLGRAINMSSVVTTSFQSAFFDQLKRAVLKHEEVIEGIMARSEGETKNQAFRLHQQLDVYRNQIVTLSGEPFGYPRPEDGGESTESTATPSAIPSEEPYL